jgi:hypothetical protein
MVEIPTMSGESEQAGLWFGIDEDHIFKLVLLSTSDGNQIQALFEVISSALPPTPFIY